MKTLSYSLLRLKYIQYILQDWLISYKQTHWGLDLFINPLQIITVITVLKAHVLFRADTLIDLIALDGGDKAAVLKTNPNSRFKLVYTLLSVKYNFRINIHTPVSKIMSIDSLYKVHSCAIWYEREAWDLMGIVFSNNPDLRRLLSDYQFKGHALRKDYPLAGYTEVFFFDTESRIIYLPINLAQENKQFKIVRSWLS